MTGYDPDVPVPAARRADPSTHASTTLGELFDVRTVGEVDVVCAASPASARWNFVTFATVDMAAAATVELAAGDSEIAIVPLVGSVVARSSSGVGATLERHDVFTARGSVFYVAPHDIVRLQASTSSTMAIGSAPAQPGYPTRFIGGDDIRVELRGGGAARRQVAHLLAPPLGAHRLILYEVHVPRGSWSGWPPHCHDGQDGSPYLEETYYFEHRPATGFGIHRNFREHAGLDDTFIAPHRSLVTVPAGYHSSAACPGSHMYFLNYLAGDLIGDDRRTPPCFDERYTWIDGHWDDDPMTLPTAGS